MKKPKSFVVIFILVVLNIWLLYNNHQKNVKIEELSLVKSKLEWRFETGEKVLPQVIHDGIRFSNKELRLIVIFSDQGCQSCIKDEVAFLNKLDKEIPNSFDTYLLTQKAPTYLSRMFDASFDVQVLDPQDKIFDVDFEFVNPIALLIDSTGLVQRIHKAEIGNKVKSAEFYRQMSEFMDNVE